MLFTESYSLLVWPYCDLAAFLIASRYNKLPWKGTSMGEGGGGDTGCAPCFEVPLRGWF